MYQEQVERILKGIVLAGVFLIPLVVFVFSSYTFFPYVVGKNFAFRIIVEVMFFAWIALAILSPIYRQKKSAILYAILGFTGVMGLATLFSFDPLRSFWSIFERMEGYVTILHLAGYFLALSSVMKTEKTWTWLMRVMLGVSVVVGLGGLLELGEANRVAGILGNAAYLGSYAMLHAGLALFLLVRPKIVRIERYVYGAIAFFNLWVMYYTATRGAMVGFIVGTITVALLYVFFTRAKEEKKFRIISGGVIALLIILGGIFFSARESSFVTENRTLRRFASISLEDKTTRSRLLVWGLALEGWKERPILGWGQENFDYVFLKYYDARLYDQEPFFDRAHNIFLDWLIAGGILGLLGYLSLYVALLYLVWKGRMSVAEKSVLSGVVLGYAAQNFFVFDTITSYIVFFTILGYVHAREKNVGEEKKKMPFQISNTYRIPTVAVCVLGMVVLVYAVNIPALRTNTATLMAKARATSYTAEENETAWKKALEGTYLGRSEAREQIVQTAQRVVRADSIPDDVKDVLSTRAKDEIEKEIKERPLHARPLYTASVLSISQDRNEEALSWIQKALKRSPEKVQFLIIKGMIQLSGDAYDAAVETGYEVYARTPEYVAAAHLLIKALVYADRIDEASDILVALPEHVRIADRTLAQLFSDAGAYNDAIHIWEDVMYEAEQQGMLDSGMLTGYASLYAKAGRYEEARTVLEDAIARFPDFQKQGEAYLEALP
ncbi:MAG: O-antigen ligase family protein [Parcubacteria group bacterium]|nr:O-antigen ligase family protein [Parcubacteria group bacterium]